MRFLFLLAAVLIPMLASAGGTLRVLAWPGYADADLVKVFEQRTGSRVEVTVIDSDDVMWQKISRNKAADFDVFAVNTAELQRYIKQGLVVPIDTAAIPNLATQMPRFHDLKAIPGLVHDGAVFAIPYTYSDMGLIYDRSQIRPPPDSITALWDPRYQGKVLAYNGSTHNFSLAALSLGIPNPFQITDKDWPVLAKRLIALRRNVLTFYGEPSESVDLFIGQHAALLFANYGSQQLKLLREAGADVGYVIPREGALAWLDCWAITRSAHDKKLAEAWINYFLEPAPSAALVSRQGLASTTTALPSYRAGDRLLWLQPVEDVDRRSRLWERILSGYRFEKVMAP
jgi:putative spermidine/putrescine transport system substrate-binding protein